MAANAKKIIESYNASKLDKHPWLIHYQVIAEYFQTRKADFTVNFTPGTFLNRDLYDSTGPKAANITSGALLGMLWPEESRNFQLVKARNIPDTIENKKYFDEIDARVWSQFTHIQSGLTLANTEYMRDEVVFGTCGIGLFENDDADKDCLLLFQAWDVKRMTISEGKNGFVNCIYYEREEPIEQFVAEFGKDNVSEKTRKAYERGDKITKVKFLHAIEPRYDRNPDGQSVFNMPVSSVVIELGEDKIIKESGFTSMTVFVGRFLKNIREKYGRSFAMDALPDVLELNALREAEIVATEKLLDPPLGVLDDGRLGSSTIDTSAGGINVFNISGRVGNQPPVFPLYTVGDMKPTKERIEELKQSVAEHFMIDRLLDMQNDTEMTLGEVMERQKLRAFILNPIFARQIAEVYSPLVHRAVEILLQKGYLGVMPGSAQHQRAVMFGEPVLVIPPDIAAAMLRGEEVYDIKYLTPAARMLQTQLASGILNLWKFLNDVAQTQPEIYDNVDEDASARLIAEYSGAPNAVLRSKQGVDQIRKARAAQQEQDKKFQQGVEMAKAAGHLKGLGQQAPAPGVLAPESMAPLQL